MRTGKGWRMLQGVVAAVSFAPAITAQDQPLSIRGTFTTGYYNTLSRGEANQSLSFIPFGARFEMEGFYKSPDLVNFSVQPELNAGPQATEAGFQGGNGIRFRMTVLRKLIPLTIRYSNVQVEDVFFGSLTQVSGYTLKNRNKDLGATLELKFGRFPITIVDWGVSSVDSKTDVLQIGDYLSSSRHINIDSEYQRWGWIFDGYFHNQRQVSNLLEPIDGGTQFGNLLQRVTQYQVSARRGFFGDWEWYMDAGSQSTSNLLFTLPINLNTHYATGNLQMFQKRRFKSSVRINYSSNLASQLLQQAIGSLAATGSVSPGQAALLPFSYGLSNLNVIGITRADLGAGFGMYASLEHNNSHSDNPNSPVSTQYLTSSAGLTYAKRMSWGSISGEYGREYGQGSVTGQSGTIQGQNWRTGLQKGGGSGPQFEVSAHGADQSVHNALPFSEKSTAVEGTIATRLIGDFRGRIGGGWQWADITNTANQFHSDGYTVRASFEHPRVQVNATINDTVSNSLPIYNQIVGNLGIGGVVIVPPAVIPSDFRAMSFTLHAYPLKKLELSALWTRSRQHIDGYLSNDFQMTNVYVTYHFRRIQIEAGFIRTNQIFAAYPFALRQRFYIRFLRSVKFI